MFETLIPFTEGFGGFGSLSDDEENLNSLKYILQRWAQDKDLQFTVGVSNSKYLIHLKVLERAFNYEKSLKFT